MEDVICSCGVVNPYSNENCSSCKKILKGTCATCNCQENITFVEANVCMWSVREDCEDISEAFEIRIDSISWCYGLMILGVLASTSLISTAIVYFIPSELKTIGVIIIGGVILFVSLYFVFLWRLNKINSFRQTLIENYKKSHPKEAELLERVGWKILP